jgi:uncharacterized protein (TIGR03546 family)
MLFVKLLKSLVSALNSEGTPFQVAAGIAMGACLGLTPIGSLHNVVVVLLAMILNLSLAGFSLGWALFVPVGFALDPLFDRIGHALLGSRSLAPFWTSLTNAPVMPFSNFDNTVVLGSFVFWAVTFVPLLLVWRWAVAKYRATVYERLKKTKFFQALEASQLVHYYRWFRPE